MPTWEENRAYRREMNRRTDALAERLAQLIYTKHFHCDGCATLVFRKGKWRYWCCISFRFRTAKRCDVAMEVQQYIYEQDLNWNEAYRLEDPDGHHILWGACSRVEKRILYHMRQRATVVRDPVMPVWKSVRYRYGCVVEEQLRELRATGGAQ